jgi:hypothetical protein
VELLKALCETEIGFQILGFDRHCNYAARDWPKAATAQRPLLPEGGY